jgi:hypothetical protein
MSACGRYLVHVASIARTPELRARVARSRASCSLTANGFSMSVLPRIDCEGRKARMLLVRGRDVDDVDLPIQRDLLVGAVASLDPVPRPEAIGPFS